MTEMAEGMAIALHSENNPECPFCPGKEEKKWKTYKGVDNSSGKLRSAMNNPKKDEFSQQAGARPKDGQDGRQNIDSEKPSPKPIFSKSKYGDYFDQAHHSISGNEIMKGHRIESVIKKGSIFTGDTGYTINNCANGVYLPAYPKKYHGIWGGKTYPKTYPVLDGGSPVVVKNLLNDKAFKLSVMKPAMDKVGQAHIGNHKGHYIEDLDKYNKTYPRVVKNELNKIVSRVIQKGKECPFCVDTKGKPKQPFVPPYKVNQWLDNLSVDIAKKLQSSPKKWTYFISEIAKDYCKEIIIPLVGKSKFRS